MKVETNGFDIGQNNRQMFVILQKAQTENQKLANDMIKISIEQKTASRKEILTSALVDMLV